jgi:hypothetical protein
MEAASCEAVTAKASKDDTLDTLGGLAKANIALGDKSLDKAEQHYKSAGLHLLEVRRRLPIERPGLMFTGFIKNVCGLGLSRAYECIRIAEGKTSTEEIRARGRERSARHAAKSRTARDCVSNAKSPPPTLDTGDNRDNSAERWERSLSNIAGDSISLRAFWTREFGEDWETFGVPSTAVTLAKQAAKEWAELAADLTKRRKAALN